jgi:hypothetical protein
VKAEQKDFDPWQFAGEEGHLWKRKYALGQQDKLEIARTNGMQKNVIAMLKSVP